MAAPAYRNSASTALNWAVLALPALALLGYDALTSTRFDFVRWTGIVATVALLAALAVTPLLRFLPSGGTARLLRKNRRYLGVAAFFYSALHLAYYVKGVPDLATFLRTFIRPEIATGWIALAIMIPLTVTSTDAQVRKLGPRWKRLHRWSYAAIAMGLAHWALAGNTVEAALYATPLVALRLAAWNGARGQA